MRLDDVTGETIQGKLEAEQFEQLVGMLLRAEFQARHAADVNNGVTGPGPRGSRGPWDLRVRVTKAARVGADGFRVPLTFDEVGETWYSCKTGPNWLELVRRDFGGRVEGSKKQSRKVKKSTKKAQQTKPSDMLLDHLAHGGRYVVCIDRQIGDEQILDEIDGCVQSVCRARGRASQSVRMQLSLITGERLAEFVRVHHPALTEPLRDKLGISEEPGVLSWTEWTKLLDADRGRPAFVAHDVARQRVLDALGTIRSDDVVRIEGPPGAGKTRTVYEALMAHQDRVRYCAEPDRAHDILQSAWLRSSGPVDLVIDEVRGIDVQSFVSKFKAAAKAGSRLILVGTQDTESVRPDSNTHVLGALDASALDTLVKNEFAESSPEQSAAIERLSAGYPWFAILLARAFKVDATVLDRGYRIEQLDEWDAARFAIAGPRAHYGTLREWEEEAELRAKCLLVALLMHEAQLEWDEIWKDHREQLITALAIPDDWATFERVEQACRGRQVLRYTGASRVRRYVSPGELARIILNHYLPEDDRDPTGRRILQHLARFRGALVHMAMQHEARPALRRLARLEWQELERRIAEPASVWTFVSNLDAQRFAAEAEPELAIRAIDGLSASLAPDEVLQHGYECDHLAWALAAALRVVASLEVAEMGERALVRLLLVQPGLAHRWIELVLPSTTSHVLPWSTRREFLVRRLHAAQTDEVLLGLAALASITSLRQSFLATPAETTVFWPMLLDACVHTDAGIRARAIDIVIENLGPGLGSWLRAADIRRLTTMVDGWPALARQRLAEERARDASISDTELAAALDGLDRALQPRDLFERTVAHVQPSWQADATKDVTRSNARDAALAGALVEQPAVLEQVAEWLADVPASRSSALALALGRSDVAGRVLRCWASKARASDEGSDWTQHLLSHYLRGKAENDPDAVDAWLREHSDDAPAMEIDLLARLPPTEARLARLSSLFVHEAERGKFSMIRHIRWQPWVDAGIDVERLLDLAAALVSRPALGLDLVVRLARREGTPSSRMLDVMETLVLASLPRRIVISEQPPWQHAVVLLAAAGRHEAAARSLVPPADPSVSADRAPIDAMESIFARDLAAALWPTWARALASELERPRAESLAWRLARAKFLEHADAKAVLGWVGGELPRAELVARMSSPHGPRLDEVTRGLLRRFGAQGSVARLLRDRARDSDLPRGDPMAFEREQLANTRAWQANHDEPEVRRWAADLEQELAHRIAEHEARVAYRRQYG